MPTRPATRATWSSRSIGWRPEGPSLIDNLLMDGAVASARGDGHWSQASVDAARQLNTELAADAAPTFVLLPVGDGVGMVQRR